MGTPEDFACLELLLDPDEQLRANELAFAERSSNLPGEEGAGFAAYYWQPGRTLRVRFLGGTPSMHALVEQHASEWTRHANIRFAFGSPDPEAELRVSFNAGDGNWSAIGTRASVVPPHRATMNLGDLATAASADRQRRVILHEFGHALGLIHEHQSPASPIEWNREVVLEEIRRQGWGWSEEMIEFNIFLRFTSAHTQYGALLPEGTAFDDQSIMLYAYPAAWLRSGVATVENSVLSPIDKAFIARIYPYS